MYILENCLTLNVVLVRQRRHGIWLKLPKENVNLVEPAVAVGYEGIHKAQRNSMSVIAWILWFLLVENFDALI